MQLGDIFINNKLLKSYSRVPDEPQKYKFPKKLIECKASMAEKGFYSFEIVKSQTKMTVLAIVLAISIIAIILFPLWPYEMKLVIFNIMFYFSASMLTLMLVRLVIYLVLFLFGLDFWIFPNMLCDEMPIIESFYQILAFQRRGDGWPLFFFRMLLILCIAAYGYNEAGFNFSIAQTVEIYTDAFNWGRDKMVGNATNQLQYTGQGHQSLDDILKMTEEYEQEEKARKEEEEREKEEEMREKEDL